MQGSINTALVPKSHACRKALGSKEDLVQTTNFVSAIDQVSYNRGPGMLKKRNWPFSSHPVGDALTKFESDLLETVPLRLIVRLVRE